MKGRLNNFFRQTFLIAILLSLSAFAGLASTVKDVEMLVEQGNYTEAYQMMQAMEERTPEYFYLNGLCMYYLNIDLNEAIVILTKSLSAGGPDRAKLILGMIYHRQNRYIDAVRLLKEFIPNAKSTEDKDLANTYIRYCQNANAIAHRGKILDIVNNARVSAEDLPVKINERDIKGILVPKPGELNSKNDEKNGGENSIMILPKDAENISTVYYSAFVPGRPDNSDIFRVKVLETGEFSKPEDLGSTINTPQDELYPFFDDANQVLYFASQGHQSIGGLDIFMSYYNAGAESWSKPVNLGLPFNSSSDDYLYMPLEGLNEYVFVTNRNAFGDKLDIVHAYVPPGAEYKTLVSTNDITEFNSLNKASIINTSTNSSGQGNKNNDPVYRELIENALNNQVKADSMKRKIHEQEQKINVALGESRKLQLSSDLKIMQENYTAMQEKADMHYEAVREYERKNNITSSGFPERKTGEANIETASEIKVYEHPVKENVDQKPPEIIVKEDKPVIREKPATVQNIQAKGNIYANLDVESSGDLPMGVVYTVQIGVFSKKVEKSNFYGLKQVFYYYITDRNLYKYYTGIFNSLDDARSHLTKVKGSDYPDAFLAAFKAQKPISVSQATNAQ